jgi:hypothetical protein
MNPYQQFQSELELQKLGMSRTELDAKLKNDAQRLSISERELALAVKRFGLSEAEFARGNYQVEQAENGNFVYVSKVPGMPSIPVPGTGGKQLSVGISPAEQARLDISLQQLGLSKQEFDQKVKQDALKMGISQQELGIALKRLDLSMADFARGNYEVKEADNGTFMYVSKVPGMPAIPVMGAGGNPLTVGISATDQARLNISLQQLGLSKQDFDQKVKQDALRMGIDQQNLGLALKRYNLSAADFARGNYKVQETEAGFSYIPTVPGMPTIPITGVGGKQLKGSSAGGNATEGERKAATLLSRMQLAEQDMGGQGERGMPGIFSSIAPRVMKQEERKRVEDAQLDFLDAALTLATGAAYTEFQLKGAMQSYFPKFGDDATTIQDKEARRKNLLESARIAAGRMGSSVPPLPPRPSAPGGSGGRPSLNNIFGAPGN